MKHIILFLFFVSYTIHAQISFFCEVGHAGVNRSIQRGCELAKIEYNWNPQHQESIFSTVVVLAGEQYARYAISLKQQGIIKKLFVGPNMFVRSSEGNGIMGHEAVDRCLVPSDWVRAAYEQDNSALTGRIAIWSAGVDTWHWSPSYEKQREKKEVIVYWKTESEFFVKEIELCLRLYGWNPIRIKYGQYNQHMYKSFLERAAFAVFISVSESQGLALTESWSMNVPTIVWDPEYLKAHGREYHYVSSCPYLTDVTGCRWKTIHDFEDILRNMHAQLPRYAPRAWVLENMTDKVAIKQLVDIIESIS